MAGSPADFRWSSFYYSEIMSALILIKARTWPEHTEENPHDPVIQILRCFAYVAHLQACRLDHAAREVYLPTARLRSSVIALARLVGYDLATAVPAEVDVLGDVSGPLAGSVTVVKSGTLFATLGDSTSPAVLFEYRDDDVTAGPTGDAGFVVLEDDGGTFTEITGSLPADPWGGTPADGDALYFRAEGLEFNKIALEISGTPSIDQVRWEYYDGFRSGTPDLTIVHMSGTLRFLIDSLIGPTPADGGTVRVTCITTGISEECLITYDPGSPFGGSNVAETTGTLGQSVASAVSADYLVQVLWAELPDVDDGTVGLTESGTVSWTLPEDTNRRWAQVDPAEEGADRWWIRVRVVDAGGSPASPTLEAVKEARKTTYTIRVEASQGRTLVERIGTTDDGSPSQRFQLVQEPFLGLEQVVVDDQPWTRVDSFLSSAAWDRHFVVREEPDGSWFVTFGDGATGKIPDSGAVVTATYRIGGDTSGNVGPGAIVRDRAGNGRIRSIRNPRSGAGWVEQEGSSAASLDTLRATIPASLRAGGRAVSPPDFETLAVAFRTADDSQVAARALAVEEYDGPKTVGVICVGPSLEAPDAEDLAELEDYFNGTTVGLQRVGGIVLANTEARAIAYTPRAISVTAAVQVLADYETGAEARILAALNVLLTPLAKRMIRNDSGEWVEGTTYLWQWGGDVTPTLIVGAIATAVEGIVSITVSSPGSPIALAEGELPIPGTLSVTVTAV